MAVGIRELKTQASEILRRVREDGESIDVTYRGRVVARLVPAGPRPAEVPVGPRPGGISEHDRAILEHLTQLGKEIAEDWPAGVSAVDAVREQRREL